MDSIPNRSSPRQLTPSYLQTIAPLTDSEDHHASPYATKRPTPSFVSLAETLYPGEDTEVVRVGWCDIVFLKC